MGERTSLVDASRAATGPESLVVLVARSVEDRIRIVSRLGDSLPLLVVSSAQEAAAFLGGDLDGIAHQGEEEAVETATDAAGAVPRRGRDVRLVEDRRAVAVGTAEVSLTQLEYGVLATLLRARGRVRSFEELSREVWGTSHVGDGAQVHAVVKRLRRKLTAVEAPVGIEVVRGVGFRAVPRPRLEAVSTAVTG